MPTVDVVANLGKIKEKVEAAAQRSGRSADAVTLVAVSKTKPFELVQQLYGAGHRDFGENRTEEALGKVDQSKSAAMDEIRWHMIGSIQSRKSSQVTGPFTLLHSVDRKKLAARLSRDASEADYVLSVLIQVNVSGEESKHGFTPAQIKAELPELAMLPNLQIHGLMTMAPFVDDAEETRPVFRNLRELRDELADLYPPADYPSAPLEHLSMGMTNDFGVAIEEGATIVRIGSAIFGER
ncbi:MAG: YggS family pyridoxal phosphate-dependent enzyme [Chloroflexota bacterium]